METVCYGKQWDVALVYDSNGSICAAMPYLIGSKYGLRYILQPQLTQYSGPWFAPGCDTAAATKVFLEHLRGLHPTMYVQSFAPATPHIDLWKGYEPQRRVTYRIDDISDLQRVYDAFDPSRRQRQIRRAERKLKPVDGMTAEGFAAFHEDYWHSRGQQDLLSRQFMTSVIDAAMHRGQGLLAGLSDAEGNLQAARFVVFDSHCAWSLMSALAPNHPNGASPLLFWHIIKQLSGRTRSFDFEGSMDLGIAYSYSLYGAKPTEYYQMTRFANPLVRRLMHKRI